MFPINLELKGRLVLLVGAGRVGQRKLRKILNAGARVRVVEPEPAAELISLTEGGQQQVELFPHYQEQLLEGVDLVFAASNQPDLNRTVATEARQRGVWVNVADAPEESDFTLPAVVQQGDFCLAISTTGASPALSAVVAQRLRLDFGPEYGSLARLLAVLRPLILSSGLGAPQREAIFKNLAESSPLLQLLAKGDPPAIEAMVANIVAPVDLGPEFHFNPDLD